MRINRKGYRDAKIREQAKGGLPKSVNKRPPTPVEPELAPDEDLDATLAAWKEGKQ